MSELPIQENLPKSEQEIVQQVEKEKHFRKIGVASLKPGLKLYTFDLSDLTIEETEIEEVSPSLNVVTGEEFKRKKVIVKENCIYIAALNQKNAIRKARKIYENTVRKIVEENENNSTGIRRTRKGR